MPTVSTPTRRNLLKAGAWSAPVIATAAAAPAAVASTACAFGLDVEVKTAQIIPGIGVAEIDLLVTVTAGSCAPGAAYDEPLTMNFSLDPAAYTGRWAVSEWIVGGTVHDRWSPSSGQNGTSSTDVMTTVPFATGATRQPQLTVNLIGAQPAPVTISFTGAGGVHGQITVTPS